MKLLLLAAAMSAAAPKPSPPPAPIVSCQIEGVNPVAVCYTTDGKRVVIV